MIGLHGTYPPLATPTFNNIWLKVAGAPGGATTDVVGVMRSLSPLIAAVALAVSGCADPVYDDAIAKLGGEAPGVRPGELHRPGQPCALCHSSRGGESEFSLAGTVFVDATSLTPIEDVDVRIVDSQNRKYVARTNCAGNFFIKPDEFTPDFPIWLDLKRGAIFREMETPVYREASCAACHSDPKGLASAGHVFLIEDPLVEPLSPASRCR
jgi:hypothetical protein